ncbi:hypothetical protein J2S43_000944 [Catenuloplanes nepalensis]|uniref:Uncharacterized protein n=1 Tax=Catenuloplanes nepalensis TaxID=587533 RepID=A0ABT9MLX9_9ACTN|nr:hypothetical protein [Catenuloplanes nepalensis]MDP9792432.1 hypothetical protein [Catenuloplanes nepalensis]
MISFGDVGRLIAFGTNIAMTPGASGERAEYRRLIHEYVMNPDFRDAVDAVLGGAECEVTDANETLGLVLFPRSGSPWSWPGKAPDLPWNKSDDSADRTARMLTIVALLAMQFPAGVDLEAMLNDTDRAVPSVSVLQLEEYIREFCERQKANEPDVEAGTPDRELPMWSLWLSRTTYGGAVKRTSRTTSTYLVYQTLDGLQQLGFVSDLTPDSPAEQKNYRIRRRLLAQFPDFLMNPLFEALRPTNS